METSWESLRVSRRGAAAAAERKKLLLLSPMAFQHWDCWSFSTGDLTLQPGVNGALAENVDAGALLANTDVAIAGRLKDFYFLALATLPRDPSPFC